MDISKRFGVLFFLVFPEIVGVIVPVDECWVFRLGSLDTHAVKEIF